MDCQLPAAATSGASFASIRAEGQAKLTACVMHIHEDCPLDSGLLRHLTSKQHADAEQFVAMVTGVRYVCVCVCQQLRLYTWEQVSGTVSTIKARHMPGGRGSDANANLS
jgi:hypothetical protein